jgi:glycosyltransferase involved in cell wall biosynthesis
MIVENLSVPFDRRVWQEARALREAGYAVSIICPQGDTEDREPYASIDGIEIHRYPLRGATGGWVGYSREYALALWHSWRIARRLGDFDVVHICNPPDLLFLVARSCKRRGAHVVFDQHDLVPELYLARFARGKDSLYHCLLALERMTYRVADVVISPNGSYRRVALERGRKAPEAIFEVRSAPDLSSFGRGEPNHEIKRNKRHLLCYLGVMGPQDGVDYALRSLAALRDARLDDWHAAFVGAGDRFDHMRALARDLGLDDRVTFTGRVSDQELLGILSAADVALAPDPYNELNDVSTMNKILEYMAVGIPIVSFDLSEARVSAGEAACYVPCDDTDAFAAAVSGLLDDPAARRRMGEAGRERIAGPLSWERSKTQLLASYAACEGAVGVIEDVGPFARAAPV